MPNPVGWLRVVLALLLAAALGARAAAQEVTLRLRTGASTEAHLWQAVVDAFEEKYPHISVEYELAGSFDELIVQMVSGVAPDVVGLQEIQIMQLLASELLLPLDPYVEQEPELLEDLFPVATLVARDRQGRLFGFPTAFSSLLWYYDQDMFDQAGVPYPDENWWWDPATGGSFVETAKKLTRDRSGDGQIDEWGMVLPSSWSRYLPFIVQNGGYYWDPEQTRSTIEDDGFVGAIDFLASLVHDARVTPPPGVSAGAFGSGSVAMYYSGRWEVPHLRQTSTRRWDVAVPPAGPAGRAATVGAGYSAITRSTAYPDEAWLLLKFLASEESYRIRDQGGQTVPPMRSLAVSDFFLGSTPPENNLAFIEVMAYGATIPLHPKWPEINDVVHPQILRVLRGETSARIALGEVSHHVTAILHSEP